MAKTKKVKKKAKKEKPLKINGSFEEVIALNFLGKGSKNGK